MRTSGLVVATCLVLACGDDSVGTDPTTATGTGSTDTGTADDSTSLADSNSGNVSTSDESSGSTGGPPAFDGLEVVFPPRPSLTDAEQLTVRGTVTPPGSVQSVTVAGVVATSRDGFATWTAVDVPLALGEQTLSVEIVDVAGVAIGDVASVEVRREAPLLVEPDALAFDPSGGELFSVHRAPVASGVRVMATDVTTGARRMLSNDTVGAGPSFNDSILWPVWDGSNQRLLIMDSDEIWAIDPVTGDREVVASESAGSGEWPSNKFDVTYDETGDRMLVASVIPDAIVAIDLSTSDATVVSDAATGSGPLLDQPSGLAVDAANGRVLVLDYTPALFAVDLGSGDRTIVSDSMTGSGPALESSYFAHDAVLGMAVSASQDRVVEVDLVTGDRTEITSRAVGSGVEAFSMEGIAFDGERLLTADDHLDAVVAIDRTSGERSYVSSFLIGSGPSMWRPAYAALDAAGSRILEFDDWRGALLATSMLDASRSFIYDLDAGTGTGPSLFATDLLVAGGTTFVASFNRVGSVDLATGARTEVSGPDVGAGPPVPEIISAFAGDDAGTQLWVMESEYQELLAIDVASGNRTVVSSESIGSGPPIFGAHAMVYDAGRLLVTRPDTLFAIDPVTGDRTELAGPDVGRGPDIGDGHSILLDGAGHAILADTNSFMTIDLATGDRSLLEITGGPGLQMAGCILDEHRVAWCSDLYLGALVAVDTTPGDAVIISK